VTPGWLLKSDIDTRIPAGHAAFLNSPPYTRFGYSSSELGTPSTGKMAGGITGSNAFPVFCVMLEDMSYFVLREISSAVPIYPSVKRSMYLAVFPRSLDTFEFDKLSYHLDEIRFASFPNEVIVTTALAEAGLPRGMLEAAMHSFVCPTVQVEGVGYQQSIAKHLEEHLRAALTMPPLQQVSSRVSPALNEKADLVIALGTDRPAIYFEIEFRPNFEKDLVKFQIAHNRGRLSAAVLIVAVTRQRINAAYKTMPEFAKVSRLLAELAPSYPLLLVGISGDHRD